MLSYGFVFLIYLKSVETDKFWGDFSLVKKS